MKTFEKKFSVFYMKWIRFVAVVVVVVVDAMHKTERAARAFFTVKNGCLRFNRWF